MRLPTFATLIAALALATPVFADTPGLTEFPLSVEHRDRSLQVTLFYPAEPGGTVAHLGGNIIFHGQDIRRDAPMRSGRLPLVLVSHGSGGNSHGLSWLGAGLADRGAIVLLLNHPGSTSGDSTPTQTTYLDRRAHDLSAALDHVLADPDLAARVDPDRIAVLGFSLGGATALQLGGARFDRQAYRAFCATYAERATGCGWMQSDGFDLMDWPASAEADLRDPRIGRVIAVEPAFGFSWDPASLAAAEEPTLLVNLGETGLDSEWMGVGAGPDSSNLAARLPQAEYHVIDDAWHYSFLAECRFYAPLLVWWEGEEPICSDPWGSDRRAVHDAVLALSAGFLGLAPES